MVFVSLVLIITDNLKEENFNIDQLDKQIKVIGFTLSG